MPDVVSIFEVGDYDEQIARGTKLLRDGGVVVLPTETVYGAAGLLTQPQSKTRLRALRGDESKPLIVHLADGKDAMQFLGDVDDIGKRMMRKLWPGPVALVFDVPSKRQKEVADSLKIDVKDIYEGSQITLRCPDQIVANDILRQADGPVALTRVPSDDWKELDGKVDLIFDAGPSRYSKASTIVKVSGEKYEIVREGVYDQRIIERLLRTTVLFVCSGNTCRSPMAEALTRRALARKLSVGPDELENKGVIVMSAGSFAMPGARATPQAVEAVHEMGGDLTRHRSRPLSVELIHQADQIFTMGRSHAAAVAALVPSAVEKTSLLNPDGEIEDPIGGDLSLYLSLAKQMDQWIEKQVLTKVMEAQ